MIAFIPYPKSPMDQQAAGRVYRSSLIRCKGHRIFGRRLWCGLGLILALAVSFLAPVVAWADDMSVSVRGLAGSTNDGTSNDNDITITSRVDALSVSEIQVNRGNCKGFVLGAKLPMTLEFGQSIRYRVFPCYPIEVSIGANNDITKFTFGTPPKAGDIIGIVSFIFGGFRKLRLTTFETIAINEIKVNRGKCPQNGDTKYVPPRLLHFGDTVDIDVITCTPIEVEILNDGEPIVVDLK